MALKIKDKTTTKDEGSKVLGAAVRLIANQLPVGDHVCVLRGLVILPNVIKVTEKDSNGNPLEAEKIDQASFVFTTIINGEPHEGIAEAPLKNTTTSYFVQILTALNGGELLDTLDNVDGFVGKSAKLEVVPDKNDPEKTWINKVRPLGDGENGEVNLSDGFKTYFINGLDGIPAEIGAHVNSLHTWGLSTKSNENEGDFINRFNAAVSRSKEDALKKAKAFAEKAGSAVDWANG